MLEGPRQTNIDFAVVRLFPLAKSESLDFRAESFNLFNQVNLANPPSDFNGIASSGGSIDPISGRVLNPHSFGRIISTSNNPRILQFALELNFLNCARLPSAMLSPACNGQKRVSTLRVATVARKAYT